MAKRKRRPGEDAPKRRERRRPAPAGPSNLPDRRVMEADIQKLTRSLHGATDQNTPLDQAQALMHQAFGERDERRRVKLARDALAVCPDCADAYVLLAEHSHSRKEALDLYAKGVAVGERAMGPEALQRDAGHFWGVIETRPYMRARLGLAHALWVAGRRDDAVKHLQDLLRLNPDDNQGVRYTLAGFLLFLDRDGDLAQLLRQYPDEGSATWAYTKALLAFRQQGDTLEARQLLKAAKKLNKHVPDYLLGRAYPPAQQPDFYSPGDRSEALQYIGGFLAPWKLTPGAIAWMRANDEKSKKQKQASSLPKGPLGVIKTWLKTRLAQETDDWQADFRRLPTWIDRAGEKVRPWLVQVISLSNELVLAHDIPTEAPTAALVWDTLAQAMQHPAAGEPHRPTTLQVRPGDLWESLRPHLEEIGVKLEVTERLDQLDAVFNALVKHVCGPVEPGLLDVPGMTPAQVGGFFEAAAGFFLRAPWKRVGYEAAIKVECDKFHSGPWYGVLMGQSGLMMGLALYENLDTLRKTWTEEQGDEESARRTVATTVSFGEESDLPVADLEAAQRHGWKVARPDAYPSIMHKERGMSKRQPLAWELELMEGCLRAVPDFVERHQQDDPAPEEFIVPVASGPLRLVLSWVVDISG
jgi:tetratricopeptide (TPR) repeat protein